MGALPRCRVLGEERASAGRNRPRTRTGISAFAHTSRRRRATETRALSAALRGVHQDRQGARRTRRIRSGNILCVYPYMDLQGQTKCTMTHVQPARAGRFFGPEGCRRKFLKFFPSGFRDETYVSWEREYKFTAHQRWDDELNAPRMRALMKDRDYAELARKAVTIESRTNLLFSF